MAEVDIAARLREIESTMDNFRKEMSDVRLLGEKIRPVTQTQSVAFEARETANRAKVNITSLNEQLTRLGSVVEQLKTSNAQRPTENNQELCDRVVTLEVETATTEVTNNLSSRLDDLTKDHQQLFYKFTELESELEELQTVIDVHSPLKVKPASYMVKVIEALLDEYEGGEEATSVLSENRLKTLYTELTETMNTVEEDELTKAYAEIDRLKTTNAALRTHVRKLNEQVKLGFETLKESEPKRKDVASVACHKSAICQLSVHV